MVRACGQPFALPLSSVQGVVDLGMNAHQSVQGQATVAWQDQLVPLARLAEVLGRPVVPRAQETPGTAEQPGSAPSVLVAVGERVLALQVDAVLGEENIVAKPLPERVGYLPMVSAVAPLDEEQLALVLHPVELLEGARRLRSSPALAPAVGTAAGRDAGLEDRRPEAARRTARRLLVVDDSVTTRELERSILEAAGYQVDTAVDGVDALARLAERAYDLVVADVDMPRLDGLALTARLRAIPHLAGLPVIIVSARGSDDDRQRGIEAGASAYIVKRTFDQHNLLDAIERLLSGD
jgi:CheY-like chemotaxis protein